MKKTTLITLFLAMLGLLLVSCKSDITQPVINSNPSAPALADVSITAQFTMANTDSLIRFSWSAPDFGFSASVDYVVEVSPKSDFSSNVAQLIKTQKLTGTAKVGDVNALLLSWNNPIGTAATFYYRVSATLDGTTLPAVYSSVKSKSITPFDAVINWPMIYAPGSYQGWTPGADNGKLFSYGYNNTYEGIIRLKNGADATIQFKITSAPDWNHTNWGGTLTQSGNNYSGTLDPSGGNYEVLPACYQIKVDVSALTISLTKTDDWGLIGDATAGGWNTSTPMFYNGQRKMWEITTDLTAGTFKFRANDAWDLNYGSNANDGTLQGNGSNIPIAAAGNYTIRFDPVAKTYTVKKN